MAERICFENVKKSSHVIVLGAGPSVKTNIKCIRKWKEQHNAVVFAANYKFDIVADYTVFVSSKIFREQRYKADGNLIVTSDVYSKYWKGDKRLSRRVLSCKTSKHKPWYKPKPDRVEIKPKGLFSE